MRVLGRLTAFEVNRPTCQLAQEDLLHWLAKAYARAESARLGRTHETDEERTLALKMRRALEHYGCSPKKIARRGICVPDPTHTAFDQMEIYRITPPSHDAGPHLDGPSAAGMLKRTQFFSKAALSALESLYPAQAPVPGHLIHVTCTGYSSPSAAQSLVDLRGWHGQSDITHAYHMGCYASLPAIRIAAGLMALNEERVDIAHTEICSLHLNPLDSSPEQMVVNSLFGDGSVKYQLTPAHGSTPGLDVEAIDELLIPGTREHMSWNTADWGMKMSLSRQVPALIVEHLAPFVDRLLVRAGIASHEERTRLRKESLYAIHPGGPRIIEATEQDLELRPEQVRHSQEVLYECGNMSSATLPYIWRSILEDASVPTGQPLISLAFGPGLTIFGALLRKAS